jgi:(p)ppGpp synthase/HD superfamily hydrolase
LAISVKIADRLHNLRDLLGATSLEKIQEYIQETKKYIIP